MLESQLAAILDGVAVAIPRGPRILDGIDLRLERGTVTALVGESGSGKTTLCRVLAGLVPPAHGRAVVEGHSVPTRGAQARRIFRRTVQMLLQDAPGSLSPRMTVAGLLAEPIAIHGLDRAAAATRLAGLRQRLGLGDALLARYPRQLSGGQARRVALARALLLEPRLLIADEPTAGLDLSVQGDLLNLLVSLQAEFGLTLLLSSHDLGVVRRIAQTTIVMYLGQIVESGPTHRLFTYPAHPYTRALLSAQPAIDPALRHEKVVLKAEPPSFYRVPPGCRFNTRCPKAETICHVDAPRLLESETGSIRCHFPETGN